MKKFSIILIILVLTVSSCLFACKKGNNQIIKDTPPEDGYEMKIMNFNIRQSKAGDVGLKSWNNRKGLIVDLIKEKAPDIVCMQEVHKEQYDYIDFALEENYKTIWYSRSLDQDQEGLAISFLKDKYELVDEKMFWLSETPEKESKAWGELFLRICVVASLKIIENNEIIDVYSAHFGVTSAKARKEEIKLILSMIEKTNIPSIVAGDFNANNKEECYSIIASKMKDAQQYAKDTEFGATYHGFKPDSHKDDLSIDFQFYTKSCFYIKSFDIVQDKKEVNSGVVYCSDHYSILSEVVFKK